MSLARVSGISLSSVLYLAEGILYGSAMWHDWGVAF